MENIPKKERIWEIDILRGFAFLMMIFDHFCFDMGFIFRNIYTNHTLLKICNWSYKYIFSESKNIINTIFCWAIFMFVSGICSTLSKNNLKRGTKLLIIATIFSIGTFIVSKVLNRFGYNMNITIYFGILQCLSICMLLTPILDKLKNYQLIILGLLIIGSYFITKNIFVDHLFLLPFNIRPENLSTMDYQPLVPRLGIYILGMVVGRTIYKDKRSIFKKERKIQPLTFFGKNALWLYFVHQIILFIILSIGILIK